MIACLGEGFQFFRQDEVCFGHVAPGRLLVVGQPRAFRHGRIALVFSGQDACSQWVIGQQAHPIGFHRGGHFRFDVAGDQARSPLCLDDTPWGEV